MSSLLYLASLCWGMELQDPQAQKRKAVFGGMGPRSWGCLKEGCCVQQVPGGGGGGSGGKTFKVKTSGSRVPSSYTLVPT